METETVVLYLGLIILVEIKTEIHRWRNHQGTRGTIWHIPPPPHIFGNVLLYCISAFSPKSSGIHMCSITVEHTLSNRILPEEGDIQVTPLLGSFI